MCMRFYSGLCLPGRWLLKGNEYSGGLEKGFEGFLWTGREGSRNGKREKLIWDWLCTGNLRWLDDIVWWWNDPLQLFQLEAQVQDLCGRSVIWWFPWGACTTLNEATLFSWGNTGRGPTVWQHPKQWASSLLHIWRGIEDGSQLSSQCYGFLAKPFSWSGSWINAKEVAWHSQLSLGVVRSWSGSHSLAVVFSYWT